MLENEAQENNQPKLLFKLNCTHTSQPPLNTLYNYSTKTVEYIGNRKIIAYHSIRASHRKYGPDITYKNLTID